MDALTGWVTRRSELPAVDHEAILDVAGDRALERLLDLIRRGHLDVAGDAVPPAVVEHLLRFGNAADEGSDETAVAEDQREGGEIERLRRGADEQQAAVRLQAVQRAADVVLGRDR